MKFARSNGRERVARQLRSWRKRGEMAHDGQGSGDSEMSNGSSDFDESDEDEYDSSSEGCKDESSDECS